MDDPTAEERLLFNTYRQFARINRMYSRWRSIYRRWIRPRLEPARTATMLDIGFGGGDIPLALAGWARRDGFRVDALAIDPDPRAARYVSSLPRDPDVRFETASLRDIESREMRFDFVVSNAVLHHLSDAGARELMEASGRVARRLAVMNDIRRSRIAYAAFAVITPALFRDSFTLEDGLASIRRSYSAEELKSLLPDGWRLERLFPCRLVPVLEK